MDDNIEGKKPTKNLVFYHTILNFDQGHKKTLTFVLFKTQDNH